MIRIPSGVPAVRATEQKRDVETFISGAPGKATYPWQAPHVRDDLMVQLNTAQPERLMLQIDWIAYQAKISKRSLIEAALKDKVAKEFARIGIEIDNNNQSKYR